MGALVNNVGAWLDALALSQYAAAFTANDIDGEVLSELDDQALKDIGVASVGHRIRLLKAIARLRSPAEGLQHAALSAGDPSAAPGGERRQLTALFCDIVGFTELASQIDPEILQTVIRQYEDACSACITRYDGYVFQRLGDGIVAFFGYPLAHEGEAERAILAGLAIVESMAEADPTPLGPLRVRIGIATGLVVISDGRGGAVGETMNLAARLQGVAPVNAVVVSERVRDLARGSFKYEDLGEQVLKGITRPTHAYRIAGVNQLSNRFDAATQGGVMPMVGREQELGVLLKHWSVAQEGEGRVVAIGGEPGIGKSRVLRALRDRVIAGGGRVLGLQASPYHVTSAYHAIIESLETLLDFRRDESADTKLNRLEDLMLNRSGLSREDVRFIADMLAIPCEARFGPVTLTPQKHKDETVRVLLALVRAVAQEQPTAMLFEDVHWADPTTLEVLAMLVDQAGRLPLLIVLTHRPEFESMLHIHGPVTLLSMSRLTKVQSSVIVSGVTGGKALPPDLLDDILAKSDGVPLYVEELTKAVVESGGLRLVGDRYEYTSAEHPLVVPATLRDSLMSRLDRSQSAKEVAKIGAVIGREFSYELLLAAAAMQGPELDSALDRLTESGLAYQRGTRPTATYVFKHALVQDVAYDSLLKAQRQALHARIAQVLETRFPETKSTRPELLARHLTLAGQTAAAIGYWHEAGKLALNRMALKEAVSHLEQGMRIVGTLPRSGERDGRELELRNLLGTAWVGLQGFSSEEAWSNFHRALRLAKALGRQDALLPIYFGLTASLVFQGRLAEGLDWVNEMIVAGESTGDPELSIMGHRSACTTHFWLGDFELSRDHGQRTLALYEDRRHRHLAESTNVDPSTIVQLYRSIDAWILGYPDQALRLSAEKDAQARLRGHAFDIGYALTMGSHVFDLLREPEQLLPRVDEAERVGRAQSLPFIYDVLVPLLRGISWVRMARVEEGVAVLQGAIGRWQQSGAMMWMPYLRSVLAEGLLLQEDHDAALRLVEESLAQIARPGWEERSHLAEVLRIKGEILKRQGKTGNAEECYLAALDTARAQHARSWELRAATSLARLWQAQGRRRQAYEILAPVYGWFTEGRDTKDLQDASRLLEQLADKGVEPARRDAGTAGES